MLKDKSLESLFDNNMEHYVNTYKLNPNDNIVDIISNAVFEMVCEYMYEDNILQDIYDIYGEEINNHLHYAENIYEIVEEAICDYQMEHLFDIENRYIVNKLLFAIYNSMLREKTNIDIEIGIFNNYTFDKNATLQEEFDKFYDKVKVSLCEK